ncbi:hypothetical protein JCM9279_004522 [Rhodotorula babjevae]
MKKASPASKPKPASKKRTTRADPSSDDDSSPPPAKKSKVKASKASSSSKAPTQPAAKPKKLKKKTEEMVLSSDSDHSSDSDLVVEQPKKKKASASSSKAKATSSKPKSKAALASRAPVEASTSTPAESLAEAPKKKKDKKPPKELPFDEALPLWFAHFADKGDKTKMDGDGIEKLFSDMDLSMDGAYPLILAWKVGAKPGTFGAFYLSDFERAFRQDKIASSDKLKAFLVQQEQVLLKPRVGGKGKEVAAPGPSSDSEDLYRGPDADTVANLSFQQFYAFLLPFFRAEGAKTLTAEAAKAMWTVVLAPKYALAQGFVDFAEDQGDKFKAVSTDLWTQLLDFCETVEPDLTGWSEDDAWPSAIDAFVEWKREKDGAS